MWYWIEMPMVQKNEEAMWPRSFATLKAVKITKNRVFFNKNDSILRTHSYTILCTTAMKLFYMMLVFQLKVDPLFASLVKIRGIVFFPLCTMYTLLTISFIWLLNFMFLSFLFITLFFWISELCSYDKFTIEWWKYFSVLVQLLLLFFNEFLSSKLTYYVKY